MVQRARQAADDITCSPVTFDAREYTTQNCGSHEGLVLGLFVSTCLSLSSGVPVLGREER